MTVISKTDNKQLVQIRSRTVVGLPLEKNKA